MLMQLAIIWLACAAIFLCLTETAPEYTLEEHD